MNKAAQQLIGQHDFTSFRATGCQANSPMRTLDRLSVSREGDEVHIRARARSFLYHQVRNFTGTLALVGTGKWTSEDVRAALEAKDRTKAGPTAPPHGLYLTDIFYPKEKLGG
jgi:tRNA pseudouridine38-40 synthase